MPIKSSKRSRTEKEDVSAQEEEHQQSVVQAAKRTRRAKDEPSVEPSTEAVDGVESNFDENEAKVDEDEEGSEEVGEEDEQGRSECESRAMAMTMKELKEELKKRDLSMKGTRKVLLKRLTDRLVKERDPNYKPREKGRHCKWCGALMVKKSVRYGEDRWGRFYGCSAYPKCQYTTNLNGYARPEREHLRGKPAY